MTNTPSTQIVTTVTFADEVNYQHDILRVFVNDYFASPAFQQMAANQVLDNKLVNNIAIGLTEHLQQMHDIGELVQKLFVTAINITGSQPEESGDNMIHVKIELSLQ